MAKKKSGERSAEELLEDPVFSEEDERSSSCGETPFDKTHSVLTVTGGPILEMMTRTTPRLAAALSIGYNMMFNYKSSYIQGRMNTLMRIHVSMGGKGRTEMVAALQSGSGVPGEFYDQGNPTMHSFVDMDGGDEE